MVKVWIKNCCFLCWNTCKKCSMLVFTLQCEQCWAVIVLSHQWLPTRWPWFQIWKWQRNMGLVLEGRAQTFLFSWGNKWNCFFVFSLWYFKNVTYNVYCSSAMRNLSWKRCEKEEAVLFRCLIRASDLPFLSSYNYVKQLMIYLSCVKYVVLKYLI